MSIYFVLFASCISLATSTVLIKAPCPDVKFVENFNFTAYKGLWFEVARYPDDWEKKGDCGAMEYDINSPDNAFNLSNVVDNKRSSVLGTVKIEGGIIYHESSDFNKVEGTSVIPVNIVAVDYNEYAIVYECIYNEATKTRHDFCWIMTRHRNKSQEVKKKTKDLIKSLGYINPSKLVWSHLTDEVCLM